MSGGVPRYVCDLFEAIFLRTSMINDHDPQRFKFQSAIKMHLITMNYGLRTYSCVCNVYNRVCGLCRSANDGD